MRTDNGTDIVDHKCLSTKLGGTAKYDNWKKIFPHLTYDYTINGMDFRTFAQIDGRSGRPVTNPYGAYSMQQHH